MGKGVLGPVLTSLYAAEVSVEAAIEGAADGVVFLGWPFVVFPCRPPLPSGVLRDVFDFVLLVVVVVTLPISYAVEMFLRVVTVLLLVMSVREGRRVVSRMEASVSEDKRGDGDRVRGLFLDGIEGADFEEVSFLPEADL